MFRTVRSWQWSRGLWGYVLALLIGAGAGVLLRPETGGGWGVAWAAEEIARPEKIGFVDFDEVYDQAVRQPRYETLYRSVERELEEFNRRIRSYDTELANLRKEVEGTAPVLEKQWALQVKMADVLSKQRSERDLAELKMLWHDQEIQGRIRDDIIAAVRTVSQERGYTLVLSRSITTLVPSPGGKPPQPKRRTVVVHALQQHNLTEAVMAKILAGAPVNTPATSIPLGKSGSHAPRP